MVLSWRGEGGSCLGIMWPRFLVMGGAMSGRPPGCCRFSDAKASLAIVVLLLVLAVDSLRSCNTRLVCEQ